MSHFDIGFTNSTPRDGVMVGAITIDDYRETFQAATSFWSAQSYERSWLRSVTRLVNEQKNSCLITSITDPATANFITTWPLYLFGDQVAIQNKIILTDELGEEFDPDEPWRYIEHYETVTEDGDPISEWRTSTTSFVEYLRKQAR